MFVCLFVCLYGTYTNSHFWTDLNQTLHTSSPWSGRDLGYVWTRNSWPLRLFGPFFFGGHCRIMGTRWLPARPFSAIPLYLWFQLVFVWRHRHDVADGGVIRGSFISVILAGVPLTSRKWRRSRRQSSATASYPLFQRVFASRHGYYVQPGDGAISHSVISLILAPVSVTYRKSRPCRRQLRVPTPSVLYCR
jgi:hypothetical protein